LVEDELDVEDESDRPGNCKEYFEVDVDSSIDSGSTSTWAPDEVDNNNDDEDDDGDDDDDESCCLMCKEDEEETCDKVTVRLVASGFLKNKIKVFV
jgi:hypothetical protein